MTFINLNVVNHNMIIYNHLSIILIVNYLEKTDNIQSDQIEESPKMYDIYFQDIVNLFAVFQEFK